MNTPTLAEAQAELVRLERMVAAQRELVRRLDSQQLPHFDTCGLKYGRYRCTCGLEPPSRGVITPHEATLPGGPLEPEPVAKPRPYWMDDYI